LKQKNWKKFMERTEQLHATEGIAKVAVICYKIVECEH
jgi:hypothetical protein